MRKAGGKQRTRSKIFVSFEESSLESGVPLFLGEEIVCS